MADATVTCPYCGEIIVLQVDVSSGSQRYIEDCPVCCRPIEFDARVDQAGRLDRLGARREDE